MNDDEAFETITGMDGKPKRILRDGHRLRISMEMRDAALSGRREGDACTVRNPEYPLDQGSPGHIRNGICVPDRPRSSDSITDGRSTDALAGCRPGFRVPAANDRQATRDAYAVYERQLTNAYLVRDNEHDDESRTEAIIPQDESQPRRSADAAQHRQLMDKLYAERDAELQNAWRTGK